MSANSVFWIASITKGFTAAAVLRLQKEGRLSVHDSLFRFLPDVPADKRNITIHQLLTHTSGLGGEYSGGGISDRSRAVQSILAPNLIFQPGAGYKYGDDDYELLAAIIEIVSGKTWENYVQKELLTPMHLAHTGFACQPHRGPVVGRAGNPENPPVSCDWGHKGANGMYSTAADLLEWTRMTVLNHSPATRPQILVRKEPPFDVSYGYGVRIYTLGDKVVEVVHSGRGDDDHTSIVRMLSSGETVIVLSNAGQHAGTTWASYIARQLASR
jgi:CubicO group peptidase (beta-lactamase class C family)